MINELYNCDWEKVYADYWEKYKEKEKHISNFINKNIDNNSLEIVLVKVMLINDFYGTNVYDTLSLAQHILSISEIDARLTSGDLKLIIDIGYMQSKTPNQYFYSFATKYCSFHNPEGFPIFDKYIEYVLRNLDKEKFFKGIESEGIETDYEKAKGLRNPGVLYKKVKYVGKEIEFFNGKDLKFIDQYLWAFGKAHYNWQVLKNSSVKYWK